MNDNIVNSVMFGLGLILSIIGLVSIIFYKETKKYLTTEIQNICIESYDNDLKIEQCKKYIYSRKDR